jgi:hypothetical protein
METAVQIEVFKALYRASSSLCEILYVTVRQIKRQRTRDWILHFYFRETEISPGCRQGEWLQGRQWSPYLPSGACLISTASRDMLHATSRSTPSQLRPKQRDTHKSAPPHNHALGTKLRQSWMLHALEIYKPGFVNGRYKHKVIIIRTISFLRLQLTMRYHGFKLITGTSYCTTYDKVASFIAT